MTMNMFLYMLAEASMTGMFITLQTFCAVWVLENNCNLKNSIYEIRQTKH